MPRLTAEARRLLTQQRRQRIARAALEVFSARGYGEATVRSIARRAGVAEGTVYLYFRGKRDLLFAAWEAVMASAVLPSVRRAEAAEPGAEEEVLAAVFRDQFSLLLRHGAFFRLVMHRADVDAEFRRRVRIRVREFLEEVMRVVEQGVRRGTLAEVDPEVVVRALGALTRGMVLFDRYDPKPLFERYPVEEVARQVARFVLYGLLPRVPAEPASGGQP
ncbi:MAG: helix-turn-helix domain-containing protein [Armatimonadota bacterium]|nr:helix-turn-helix domain-containing protein [Armatimonadota bacterium]